MRQDRRTDRPEAARLPGIREASDGVVFDFSGKGVPDIRNLTLLVTARMLAEREERHVWVRALPHRSWKVLESLGLAHLFRLFPAGGTQGN